MAPRDFARHLRAHRKRSGLTQREVATLLGYASKSLVSRHETASGIPTLDIGLAYEAIFRIPISQLFPELYRNIEASVEERLSVMEADFRQKGGKGRNARVTAQKLEWTWARKHGIEA
jgi:transcriptional regulator with XRE-family HTH domain